jgi:hypothetical protein
LTICEFTMQPSVRGELLAAMRGILRTAILTLLALRDPDARYLGWGRLPMHVVHDVTQAYGYDEARPRRFQPTPHDVSQMERVAPWLAWLRREHGQIALRRMIAWAVGVPVWRLAQREQCSEKTISNRVDRSVAAIVHEFAGADLPVEHLDELPDATHAMVWGERPAGEVSGEIKLMKIYIGGRGLWRKGKWLKDQRGYAARRADKLSA